MSIDSPKSRLTAQAAFVNDCFNVQHQEIMSIPEEPSPQRLPIHFTQYREDLRYWVETDRKMAINVLKMEEEIIRDPFKGRGKPERLKFQDENVWSRRLNEEHRIVYILRDEHILFVQARYHY